jgi:hypothetical protein
MEMQPIDPNKPLPAAITAQEWNALMTAATSHYLIVSPSIIEKLMAQLRQPAPMTTAEMAEVLPDKSL